MATYQGESAILEKSAVQAHINKMVEFYGEVEYPDLAEKYREEIRILKVEINREIDYLSQIQKEANDASLSSSQDKEYQIHLENIGALSEYNAVLNRILDAEIEIAKREAAKATKQERDRKQAELAERERLEAEEEAVRAAEEAAALLKKIGTTKSSLQDEIAKIAKEEKDAKRNYERFEDFKNKAAQRRLMG